MQPKSYVVLGGGITGLSTAWHLSRLAPKASKITLVEKTSHLGGWVHTKLQHGQIFELGPRTLRPVGDAGRATLEMVHQLNLQDEVLTTAKTSPAAINRYIYKDARLHQLPTSPLELLAPWKQKSPLLKGLVLSLLKEPFVAASKASDESIHSFVSRRFGQNVADNLVSAVLHGIYAGNAKELSVRSAMPLLWELEKKHGSVGRGLLAPPDRKAVAAALKKAREDAKTRDANADAFVRELQSTTSIYSFKDGMQTLTDALHRDLETKENVELVRGEVEQISLGPNPEVFHSGDSNPIKADHVISTLPASALHSLLPSSQQPLASLLSTIKSVNVATVNLAFRGSASKVLSLNGFGYLIPLTEPTGVLGIVFDSCAMPEQDAPDATRMTVMMGGHRFEQYYGNPDTVSMDTLRDAALTAARTHLGIDAELIDVNVALHRQCIPQYTVGHHDRLQEMHNTILRDCGGTLSLAGASYFGVGVNDCVKGARDLVTALLKPASADSVITGLERVEL
ncbi:Protoporphyrinogen oxidase [Powellomyces hirtus]|nr:Protoporphyrinogen oxidase [Powellomyces hirtus]